MKRTPGHSEPYDERKLYTSIYASCLSVRTPAGSAKITATDVCRRIAPWLSKKPEITSADIRRKASEHLDVYNTQAAFVYKFHRALL